MSGFRSWLEEDELTLKIEEAMMMMLDKQNMENDLLWKSMKKYRKCLANIANYNVINDLDDSQDTQTLISWAQEVLDEDRTEMCAPPLEKL